MQEQIRRIVALTFTVLILIFSIIHFGVSIGALARFGRYGDTFRPERGLGGFNLVISIYGFLIGGVGLFAVLTDRGILSKIVALAAVVLALFAGASLITALVINSKAINYQSSRFSNNMRQYATSQQSKNVIDNIQTRYSCCGNNIWVDWAPIGLNATTSGSGATTATGATTAGGGGAATTTAVGGGSGATTTAAGGGGAATTTAVGGGGAATTAAPGGGGAATTTAMGGGGAATTAAEGGGAATTAAAKLLKRNVEDTVQNPQSSNKTSNDSNVGSSLLQQAIRQKRQSSSGSINGLPISSSVTLPQSCCTNSISSTDNLNSLYCIVSPTNGSNGLHNDGCTKLTGSDAVGYSLGFAVINTFLVIISLAAIPLLFEDGSSDPILQNTYIDQTMPQDPQQYGYGAYDSTGYAPQIPYDATGYATQIPYDATGYAPQDSYNNYNAAY